MIRRTALSMLLLAAISSQAIAGDVSSRLSADEKNGVAKALESFVTSIGCNFGMSESPLVVADVDHDGEPEYLAIFFADVGCAGGSSTTGSLIGVVNHRNIDLGATEGFYVRPELSGPVASVVGAQMMMESIEAAGGALWLRGKTWGPDDPGNFPLIAVRKKLTLTKIDAKLSPGEETPYYAWIAK